MTFNRRDLLRMSSSSLALTGIGQVMVSFVPGATQAAAPTSDLSSYDAMGLAELLRTKQITPREVIEDTVRKIEAINPKLNAVIHKTYESAREQASQPLGDGSFAGVPLLVKDNATIAGVLLTQGSRALRGNVPDKTAPGSSSSVSRTCPRWASSMAPKTYSMGRRTILGISIAVPVDQAAVPLRASPQGSCRSPTARMGVVPSECRPRTAAYLV
jgi:Amidase